MQLLVAISGGSLLASCQRAALEEASVPTLADVADLAATHRAGATQLAAQPTNSATPAATAVSEDTPPSTPPAPSASPTNAPENAADRFPARRDEESGILVTHPQSRFYETRYRTAGPRPELDRAAWQLEINGWVGEPLTLGFDDLMQFEQREVMRTLQCISNPPGGSLIGNAFWTGVPLAAVLAQADIRTGAREIKMTAADGYDTSIPIELALADDSLLVYQMNGGPLPVKHGFPVRVLLASRYGQKQPKWITGIEVITDNHLGYWEERGWSNDCFIQINAIIWEPSGFSNPVSNEMTTLRGVAFADESGVASVEVSVDGGLSWTPAEMRPGPDPSVWTEWSADWLVPPVDQPQGLQLQVRATDGNGVIQRAVTAGDGLLDTAFPNGSSQIHEVVVVVNP
ncbi:MAG: molybdopterin-dependent oxidoreductase [Chloroflexi bacterium]|nr:molybdopterin-dependent oxidoreductase [Chloroflexota bacterium]